MADKLMLTAVIVFWIGYALAKLDNDDPTIFTIFVAIASIMIIAYLLLKGAAVCCGV